MRHCYASQIAIRVTPHFIIEAMEVRALACWPYFFLVIQHLSESRRVHHWRVFTLILRERRSLQSNQGKGPPC